MDNNTTSTPEWVNHLIEGYEKEILEAENITLLPDKGRNHIWRLCKRIGLSKHGIPGQACYLLERYFAKTLFSQIDTITDAAVAKYMNNLKGEVNIIIRCCILLAVKMFKNQDENFLRNLIFEKKYGIKDIVRIEIKVFQALDFYIPLSTTVEIAQQLASEVKVSNAVYKEIDRVLSQAELYKPRVIEKVRWVADDDKGVIIICRLHLAAGGVAAASYLTGHQRADPALPLGHLTHAPSAYITAIARAILCVTEIRDD